ncbi:formamidopyrimidine-DNA glycosylase [gamma proteobacterium NOR5-3]|nr:formamidopyrimidine-DNA glycosylase [gamma proteobacterium NOR5-3]
MPELPEVETTRRGLRAHSEGRQVVAVTLRDTRLRWPVPTSLPQMLRGQSILALERRAKYLLFRMDRGTLLVHLGMSGSLRVLLEPLAPAKHDHIDIELDSGALLRYNDPRRFGSFQWFATGEPLAPLGKLGPEPLSDDFHGGRLFDLSRGRKIAIKPFIMDGATVVGVGNIYASEALYLAGIRPDRAASRVSRVRYELLAGHIKQVLTNAIEQGGTTLRDFVGGDGKPGYFAQQLYVYGRSGEPCKACGTTLRDKVIGQRASVYCIACQR